MKKATAVFDKILDYTMLGSAILVVVMALMVSEEVIVRKLFNFTWPPLFEIVEYILLWMTFLGAAWILRKGTHIKMDSIISRFPMKTQALLNFVSGVLCAFLLAAMTFYTAKLTIFDYQTGYQIAKILNPPKWPVEMIIPFTFLLLFIQSIRNGINGLNLYRAESRQKAAAEPALTGKEQA